jgi:hypothetical protein
LPRGKYKLTVRRDGETSELDSEYVNLRPPLNITTKPASPDMRVLGLSMLITGAVAAGAGLVAIFPNLLLNSGCQNCNRYIDLARAGYIAAASGGVMCLVGVLLYLNNRTSFVIKRLKTPSSDLSLHLAPNPTGVAALLTGRF